MSLKSLCYLRVLCASVVSLWCNVYSIIHTNPLSMAFR